MEKWSISDKNHNLTPREKSHFLTFLTFYFYGLKRGLFVLEYRKDIFLAYKS